MFKSKNTLSSPTTTTTAITTSTRLTGGSGDSGGGDVGGGGGKNGDDDCDETTVTATTFIKPPVEKHKHKHNPEEDNDIIGELIGEYGKWQFVMTILLSLFQVPNTFHIYSPTFQVSFIFILSVMIS